MDFPTMSVRIRRILPSTRLPVYRSPRTGGKVANTISPTMLWPPHGLLINILPTCVNNRVL